MAILLINLLGVLLIALIVWWFWFSKPRLQRIETRGPVDITVDGGVYAPAHIEVPAGKPVTLRFIRKDPTPCAEEVIFDTLNVSAELPVGEPKEVTVTPQEAGEYEFTCQMGMYRGKLIAK